MNIVPIIISAVSTVWTLISAMYFFRIIFTAVGVFFTRKFPRADKLHKYAVLIAARNEESVIGKLIESIRLQDYPAELVKIFVVADNCTDSTAEVARSLGAVCYERHDNERRTKGYALRFLVECIRRDYTVEAFDGYFLFDADNLLKPDYISRMNEAFDAGEKIITSYRNTKNFDSNWISASYGIHWIRTVRTEHRARSFFHLATRIQGTGFLFANEIIKDGWKYTGLTEDRALCADAVANGYKISYNDAAEFYDEQPTDIRIAMRQRIRWAKGHLQALTETGGKLFKHIFVTKKTAHREHSDSRFKRFINNLRLRFMSFDMLTVVFPRALAVLFKRWGIFILRSVMILTTPVLFFAEAVPAWLQYILDILGLSVSPGGNASAVGLLFLLTVISVIPSYLGGTVIAAYVYISERRRIGSIKWYKKLWYCLTFPLFDVIGRVSMLIALFIKVEWKPIPHSASVGIDELCNTK